MGKQKIAESNILAEAQLTERETSHDRVSLLPGITGQSRATSILLKAIESDRLSHAFLFIGSEGCGRFALAVQLARVLNCTKGVKDFTSSGCGCNSCRLMNGLQHPSLTLIFPLPALDREKGEAAAKVYEEIRSTKALDLHAPLHLSGSGLILIDQIREFRASMALASDRGGVRVAVVQPADRMTVQASNALLKLLEEPPDKCCIILIAEHTRSLLPTIQSRCQVLRLSSLPTGTISGYLQQQYATPADSASTIARLSAGNMAAAIEMLDENVSANLDESLNFLRATAVGNSPQIASMVDEWTRATTRQDVICRLKYVGMWLKDAMVCGVFPEDIAKTLTLTTGYEETLVKMAALYGNDKLSRAWWEIEETRQALESNAIVAMALTTLAIRINRIFK